MEYSALEFTDRCWYIERFLERGSRVMGNPKSRSRFGIDKLNVIIMIFMEISVVVKQWVLSRYEI